MALKISTGLRNALLDTGDLKTTLDGGFIHIYDGTPPASPDEAITGTLLATIYSDGGTANTGLSFATAATDGVIQKASAEVWDNSAAGNIAGGLATHYLHVGSAESDGTTIGASTTAPRILGTVALAGGDMDLANTTLVATETQTINFYSIALPESC